MPALRVARPPHELSTAECLDVVEHLARLGTREVSLIGGEALPALRLDPERARDTFPRDVLRHPDRRAELYPQGFGCRGRSGTAGYRG
jgi:hypothetical protein